MRNGRLLAFPISISKVKTPPKGRRLIGMTKAKELAIVEWQPDGNCKMVTLMPKVGYPWYAIGDWDGDGKANETIVLKGNRLLLFREQNDGQWRKSGELNLPSNLQKRSPSWLESLEGYEWGVSFVYPSGQVPLFFWEGRWHWGKRNEQIRLFISDWDGDRQKDKLLARISPNAKALTLQLMLGGARLSDRKRSIFQRLRYGDWRAVSIAATDKLGDGTCLRC